MPQNNPLPTVAPITDPNAGPTPAATSTNLAPADPSRFQSKNSPSGLGALLGSIASAGSSGVGLLGGLLSSGLGMIGDAINFKRQNKLYDKQRADALADYDKQRSDYLADLASERAYNSPAAQVARLKAAGINPNTVFGSGSVSNTSSDATNQAGFRGSAAPSPVNSGLGSAFASGFTAASSGQVQSGMLDVQAQQTAANIDLQRAEAYKALSSAGLDFSRKVNQEIANKFADSMFAADLRERAARTNSLIDSMETAALDRLETRFRIDKLLPVQVENIKACTQEYFSKIRTLTQQADYFDSVKETRKRSEFKDFTQKTYEDAELKFKQQLYSSLGDSIADKNAFLDFYRDIMLYGRLLLKGNY